LRLNRPFTLFGNGSSTVPGYGLTNTALRFASVDRSFFMRRLLARFVADESGATAIEYALIAAGISIVIVTAVNGVGTAVSGKFAQVSDSFK
jgi:pilus assembly protein Flp/PilA